MSNYAACHHDVEAPIDADNRGVTAARDRALAMIEDREPPFDADSPPWRPDPDWAVPRLP